MVIFRSTKGFTLVELLITVGIVGMLAVIGTTAYNTLNITVNNLVSEIQGKLFTLDTQYQQWWNDKQTYPNSTTNFLLDSSFVGPYAQVPQAFTGQDTSLTNATTTNGYLINKNTASGGGTYIAMKISGTPSSSDTIWQALVKLKAKYPVGKFYFNCGDATATADCSTASPIAGGIVLYWIGSRNP